MKLIVVLPTYNEAENLETMVGRLLALELPVELAVLVVDDNSPDGTGQIADRLAAEHPGRVEVLHRQSKRGLGTAYIEGFRLAFERGADYILQMDCDFSHDPQYIPAMITKAETSGCDIDVSSTSSVTVL